MQEVIIIGAGGHAAEVSDYIRFSGDRPGECSLSDHRVSR